jgi:hypothetical protein
VGAFAVTSLSPARVDKAGGTLVTVEGDGFPAGAKVRVGSSAAATVVSVTPTRITFRAPVRAIGVYDVFVFSADGRKSSVLPDGLEYIDSAADGGTAPGGTTPGAGGGGTTPEPDSDAGTGDGTPGPDAGNGEDGDASDGSTAPSASVVRTGPAGERLVRSAKFAPLSRVWSMSCTSSCTGVAL